MELKNLIKSLKSVRCKGSRRGVCFPFSMYISKVKALQRMQISTQAQEFKDQFMWQQMNSLQKLLRL